ncbi:ABC transporter ATP-binding protein [Sporichthya sp.]|uniref:ABC transporter ATP-binding protein n=1 Tax=Sporichthya sp. TaxID=65475 RepID=UPI0017C22563|nr:ABC transporter ATP-binding protein [Sporichthya sp.]MBA3741411.1 ABC transporter ATP-binding protein [Sporichthya sp.]
MLELSGIVAGYDSAVVLRNVDLVVPPGAVVALLGPNGAGKTTLLRVASGLLAPTEGRVLVEGKDMTGSAPYRLAAAGVCHIPEGRGIFPALSVAENLRLQTPPGGGRMAERAVEVFPRLGERMSQLAGTLSGGEQQMLALARAYLCNPKLVLLDEVSMGLAPKIVDEIFEYLHTLAAQGTAMLLVEQYVGKALALADYVHILKRGRINFAGEPCEIGEEMVAESYLGVGA